MFVDGIHVGAGAVLFALAIRYSLRVERQQKEIDRLRRAIAFYQADAHELQAELRRSFESECG